MRSGNLLQVPTNISTVFVQLSLTPFGQQQQYGNKTGARLFLLHLTDVYIIYTITTLSHLTIYNLKTIAIITNKILSVVLFNVYSFSCFLKADNLTKLVKVSFKARACAPISSQSHFFSWLFSPCTRCPCIGRVGRVDGSSTGKPREKKTSVRFDSCALVCFLFCVCITNNCED